MILLSNLPSKLQNQNLNSNFKFILESKIMFMGIRMRKIFLVTLAIKRGRLSVKTVYTDAPRVWHDTDPSLLKDLKHRANA